MTQAHDADARFRLFAYEQDWLRPLAQSHDNLAVVLLAEAEAWRALGQRLGYFAMLPRPSGRSLQAAVPDGRVFDAFFDRAGRADVTSDEFAAALSQAQNDLSPERREFLFLVFVADWAHWQRRLLELGDLAAAISHEGASAPTDLLDRAAWSMQGAATQIEPASVLPAGWRAAALDKIPSARVYERLQQLAEARATVLTRIEWLRDDERTTLIEPWERSIVPRKVRHEPRTVNIGDIAPDFAANTTEGPIRFHEWIGDSWVVLFSQPESFTPVATTEVGYMAHIKPEFDRRNVKILGLSLDSVADNMDWAADIEETQGTAPNYPIIADTDFAVARAYGMLPADTAGGTPAQATLRNVFVIGPDKKIKLVLIYPMTTGRNFDEILRVIDSLQLTANHQVATPAQWRPGENVLIAGSVTDEQAKARYPDGWLEPKPYIRIVPEPREN